MQTVGQGLASKTLALLKGSSLLMVLYKIASDWYNTSHNLSRVKIIMFIHILLLSNRPDNPVEMLEVSFIGGVRTWQPDCIRVKQEHPLLLI